MIKHPFRHPSTIFESIRTLAEIASDLSLDLQDPDIMLPFLDPKRLNYKLEDFKEIFQRLSVSPWNKKERLIFIPKADQLNPVISNKLLKTLEESTYNRFIFVCPNKNSLLSTIISRSLTIKDKHTHSPQLEKNFSDSFQLALEKEEIEDFPVFLQASIKAQSAILIDACLNYSNSRLQNNANKKINDRVLLSHFLKHYSF